MPAIAPYVPRIWQDSPSTATPIDAESLIDLEDGVRDATAQANAGVVLAEQLEARRANALPSYAPSGLLNRYDEKLNVYNLKPGNSRRLRAGLARAKAGELSHHLFASDSAGAACTNGVSVPPTYDRSNSIANTIMDVLNRVRGVPIAGEHYRMIDGSETPSYFTSSGSWTLTNAYVSSSANAASYTLTTKKDGTAVKVRYFDSAGFTFTITVGGVLAATVASTGSNTWRYYTVTGLVLTANVTTVVVAKTNAVLSLFASIVVYKTSGGLLIHNCSQSGGKIGGTGTASWTDYVNGVGLVHDTSAGKSRVVTDMAFTNGSPNATSATAAFTDDDRGKPLWLGVGVFRIPLGTYILSVTNATTIVMSANAILTSVANTVAIGRDPDVVWDMLGGNDKPVSVTSLATLVTKHTAMRNRYPNSDFVIVIEEQQNSATLITDADWEAYAATLYTLADSLDVILVDLRARIGNYTTASNDGLYGDAQAHLTSGAYQDLGANIGMAIAS